MPNAARSKGSGHHGRAGGGAEARTGARMGSRRRILARVAMLAVAAVLGVAVATYAGLHAPATRSPVDQGPGGDIGGPFALRDQAGRPADQRLLLGKWSAVFFGYVSCPDTCPATLQALQATQARLTPAEAARFQVVFVTVDPDRDGPAQLRVYLDQPDFPRGTVGLTGTPAQVAAIARAYRVYYARAPRKDGGYDMDHSAAIYLMDPRGRFSAPLSEVAGPEALATQVRAAMRGG